jgi:hypothetical protein
MMELKEEKEKSTVVIGDFNIILQKFIEPVNKISISI